MGSDPTPGCMELWMQIAVSLSIETEASLEISADLGYLPAVRKAAARPLVTGPLGKISAW